MTIPTQFTTPSRLTRWLAPLLIGLLLPFGFAPFHLPGLSILGVALFYLLIQRQTPWQACLSGLVFGIGYFGLGVSWIYNSIHAYGHFHPLLAGFITLLFTIYLASYTSVFAWGYTLLTRRGANPLQRATWFSCLWVLMEYARSHFCTGFPWLLLGLGQFDSPLKAAIPVIGIYGTGFITCFSAMCLAHAMSPSFSKRIIWLISGLALLLLPSLALQHRWTQESSTPMTVGLIQANLSMRDKWDEHLFWTILNYYEKQIQHLLGTDLIVLPESAIPLPASYLHDVLETLHQKTKKSHSALLLGIPALTPGNKKNNYHNALLALGQAKGHYLKQHLVPFGEYIPLPFKALNQALGLPDPDLSAGLAKQALVTVHHHPIASLICYELAYDDLLRAQLPEAEWIVSISDDGWFGHSLAMYQQLQIAQVRSLQTGRYQVVSNNDGRSSILNTQGDIIASLPAFTADTLRATLNPATGMTPWVQFGDTPILIFLCMIFLATHLMIRTSTRHPELADPELAKELQPQ